MKVRTNDYLLGALRLRDESMTRKRANRDLRQTHPLAMQNGVRLRATLVFSSVVTLVRGVLQTAYLIMSTISRRLTHLAVALHSAVAVCNQLAKKAQRCHLCILLWLSAFLSRAAI